jgi:hypothetical protein
VAGGTDKVPKEPSLQPTLHVVLIFSSRAALQYELEQGAVCTLVILLETHELISQFGLARAWRLTLLRRNEVCVLYAYVWFWHVCLHIVHCSC